MQELRINHSLRAAVFAAWGRKCAYCRDMPAEHLDHIFPKASGGQDIISNFAPACALCNMRKNGHVLAEGFLRIMAAQARSKEKWIEARIRRHARASLPRSPVQERRTSLVPRAGEFVAQLNLSSATMEVLSGLDWHHAGRCLRANIP
ncbi:HNH endonuclease [Pseudogemmobacter faecipullorum]|uniref:HNH endonuclease n=1 Tax=Pseudogemmobacter faecipullorum TaxID=2755041 RepID=A0ABS8CT30_9RHOB|nr:HNH endonuclease [Pseudogemmobacter faecipullorum]